MSHTLLAYSSSPKNRTTSNSPKHPLGLLPWKSLKSNIPSVLKKQYGSPSYPSPLDRIRTGRCERALQLGLTPPKDHYYHNQSLPCGIQYHLDKENESPDMGDLRKSTLDKFKGDALNTFSFSHGCSKGSFARTSETPHHRRSLSGSWVFYNFIGGSQTGSTFPTSVQNPNKAIVTINAKTTEILVANKMAYQLLGLPTSKLSRKKLSDFFITRKGQYSLTETELEASGELVLISGKVMDLINFYKEIMPVSVWVKQLPTEDEPRCLVVMEPVERTTAVVTFNSKGKVLSCDKNMALLHGHLSPEELEGVSITDLIPSLVIPSLDLPNAKLPKEMRKQRATGRTKDGATFPLSILIKPIYSVEESSDSKETKNGKLADLYKGIIWVFANISGMITVFPDGTIHSCNTNFSLMLFGFTQDHLVGKSITMLIPSFYDDLEFLDTDSMPLPPLDDEDEEDSRAPCCCASDGRTTADSLMTDPPRPANPIGKQMELMVEGATEALRNFTFSPAPVEINHSPDVKEASLFGSADIERVCTNHPAASSNCTQIQLSSKNDELFSESSSHFVESSMQLTISESQETLHSYDGSITESDVNGNILDATENEEANKLLSRNDKQAASRESGAGDAPILLTQFSNNESDSLIPQVEEKVTQNEYFKKSDCKTPLKMHSYSPVESSVTDENNSLTINKETGKAQNSSLENKMEKVPNTRAQEAITSTPRECTLSEKLTTLLTSHLSEESLHSIPEGSYFGLGRHRDGSDLAIIYQIRRVELDDGKTLYCLWVSRDPEEIGEGGRPCRNLTLASSLNSTLGQGTDASSHSLVQENNSQSISINQSIEPADAEYIEGPFAEKYTILQQIGKGAFGCVKMAYRNCNKLLVITKFIRKSKVYDECWVFDSLLNHKVPLEVSLLTTLKHPNIVQVLDVFENDDYFQMVMEKHGAGMDLFEFIDRNPRLDEQLASYIFRQVVSALNYLHSLNILHRDVKDENIILDEHFHVKLIDFGSATFMSSETLFSTFCGTMEYCSPEVIQGNMYRGPELEMWALGVTLYTLIFGENPFFDIDETIVAILKPPFKVSKELMHLISWLLNPDPMRRCTLKEAQDDSWTNQPFHPEKYKFDTVVNASPDEINPPKFFLPDQPVAKVTSFGDICTSLRKETCVERGPTYSVEKGNSTHNYQLHSSAGSQDSVS